MEYYVLYYIVIINIIGFWSMWEDKKRAINRKYRLPEKTLFTIALMGGSIGSIVGMYSFRHKTKHLSFKIGMPMLLVLQILILLYKILTT